MNCNFSHSTAIYKPEWGLLVNGTYTGLAGVIYRKVIANNNIIFKYKIGILDLVNIF